ncbi:sensor histidine kinase [Litorilituus sediminis]|uniref:histidine kinase n=1 Tax=Litorilituus sediminis TaxID=718192 RepID=A0A4P6P2I7_9GAMM|nr:HAMP domain-containing sensor histidine kinase [Litorilituus sediminis]QBG35403.1 HAMP domain-containing histidine kinase [Litorilituus sediminis]
MTNKSTNKSNSKNKKFHSLSRRIVAQFCLFTLVLSVIFSLLTFILLFTLEDSFIEREIVKEADYLIAQYQQTKQWPQMRARHFTLHFSKKTLPDDMREKSMQEPERVEFYGQQGRHYHLYAFPNFEQTYLLAEVSEKLLVRPLREGIITILVVSGVSLTLVACMLAWLLGRKTAKPLKALADLVDGVAPENIPDSFAHQFPNNEIGVLANTLEASMAKIRQAIERERCFTRDVSHELRTPVAIVKNAVELYREKSREKSREKYDAQGSEAEIINRINDASLQMEQTVTTLLHLAREEHAAAEQSAVKLLPLIEQSIIEHSYLLDDKSVEVQVDDNCNTEIVVQQGMLKVLLDNLLSNAFQYTDSGMVEVSFANNTLTIADTGPGIEAGISKQVTEPAIKGSQSTGYGFGLSIVKRLCEHQKWQLSVESKQGTRISVRFV